MCIESGLSIGVLDLVVACGIVKLWSERAVQDFVEESDGEEGGNEDEDDDGDEDSS